MWVDATVKEADQLCFVEAPVVVDPAGHDAVDPRGDFVETQGGAAPESPAADLGRHVFLGVLTDRGQKPGSPAAVPFTGVAGSESVSQEGELNRPSLPRPAFLAAMH